MGTRGAVGAACAAVIALGASTADAQTGRVRTLVFAESASARIETTVTDGAALVGAPMRATITDAADGSTLWSGELGRLAADGGAARLVAHVRDVRPKTWSPQTPDLYRLVVSASAGAVGAPAAVADTVRFGFRSIRSANGRILLNGRPVFLRGNAINPPGRNLPDSLSRSPRFAADYLRFLKGVGVNIVRFERPSQVWFDAADEVGMMVFQGHYGTPRGATSTTAPKDLAATLRWYRDSVVAPQASHPSVVVYALANEQAAKEIGYLSQGHEQVAAYLQKVYEDLRAYDGTRLYIGNAGYGFGRAGELCDLHRYWGWYYNSFLSFYTLRDPRICWRSDAVQPMTLTENTGNYTGPDGRFNLVADTKQPDSQLNWSGHAPDAEQAERALSYQAWMAGQAIEITRRLRARNPYLAGLSPFTIAFSNWHDVGRLEDMKPKPVLAQYARSYQPVLLSWESWTPHAYAGSTLRAVAHVVNDDDAGRALRAPVLHWALRGADGRVRREGRVAFGDVPHYATAQRAVAVALPRDLATGDYVLAGALVRGADTLSRNETWLMVAARDFSGATGPLARRVRLFDPAGRTAAALRALGIPFTSTASVAALDPARDALVVGSGAWSPVLARDTAAVRAFMARGGRALLLDQRAGRFDGAWLPGGVRVQTAALDHPHVFPGGRPFAQGMAVNPERPDHPVLSGLGRDHLFLFSDYTEWSEASPGFPAVYPVTHGLALTRPEQMGDVAVLANYDHGLQGVALAEFFVGRGSALLSGFDLVNRAGLDPAADRLLRNLVRYVAGDAPHEAHPLVADRVVWGDYASERGLVTGIHSGLLLHTVPVVPAPLASRYPVTTDADGFAIAGERGGWNTKPAIQYVGRGRRPFGPYDFSTGGSVRLPAGHSGEGEGRVWMRVPAGRRTMLTTIENPVDTTLELTIIVDGAAQRHRVAPNATITVETPISPSDAALALAFRGDRRLVLRETSFR